MDVLQILCATSWRRSLFPGRWPTESLTLATEIVSASYLRIAYYLRVPLGSANSHAAIGRRDLARLCDTVFQEVSDRT